MGVVEQFTAGGHVAVITSNYVMLPMGLIFYIDFLDEVGAIGIGGAVDQQNQQTTQFAPSKSVSETCCCLAPYRVAEEIQRGKPYGLVSLV